MHSARGSEDQSAMHCSAMGVRMQRGVAVQGGWALLHHLGCSIVSASATSHRSQSHSVGTGGSNLALHVSPL